ncbi:hypothetical protein ABZ721_18785 [Streptomyces sp. NPDC006733]|uniref:hypothetical protein n=1 Tax=Streptomyces sp. NPDC006733 TaxID=3155460 RepID=UPI0033C379E4
MTDTPYVERAPGDLLTAEDWNQVQLKIYADIRATAQAAADGVTHVAGADNADHLEGKDLNALTEEVTRRVLDQVRGRTGYQQLFKMLRKDDVTELEHQLGSCPLVDVYELDYFKVACREDDETRLAWATFYLHHRTERRVRVRDASNNQVAVDIQPKDFPELGIPFADLLTRYRVPYTDSSTLDDLETEFWKAFFKGPNDQFGDDTYCHSPWFERCCKQNTTVEQLKAGGDWNDLLFQFRPRRTLNFPAGPGSGTDNQVPIPAPANVMIQHLDLNRTAVWFRGDAVHGGPEAGQVADYLQGEYGNELAVMILLKA